MCQQMADAMAESKRKVVYFNFEISWDQLVARSLSSRLKKHNCCIPASKILWHEDWSEEETRRIEEQAEAYEREVLSYLTYNPEGVTNKLESVLAYLERLGAVAKKNEQAPVVFVDYLQLIGTAKNWDRQELIKQTVLGLKDYAKNMIPLLWLSLQQTVPAIPMVPSPSRAGGTAAILNIRETASYLLTIQT